MICFDRVSKFILSDITLHVPRGKTIGLAGACGAGKSTFLKLCCGLLSPDLGKVYVMGEEPFPGKGSGFRFLGALFSDKPALHREDTVRENFRMLGAVYRLPGKEFCKDYEELSRRLGFAGFEEEKVSDLSLGQLRRAEIGAALLHRPKILILDEPSLGLDENARWAFRELLAERKKEECMTVLMASHDRAELSTLCDRIALFNQGKLLFYGDRESLRSLLLREELVLRVSGAMPDLEDLPVEKYCFDGEELRVTYRTDDVTAAEILAFILRKCHVAQVDINRQELTEFVTKISGGDNGRMD